MKFYQQEGTALKRTYLHESGNICKCCEDILHAHTDDTRKLPDDVECEKCHALCACSCHRKEED